MSRRFLIYVSFFVDCSLLFLAPPVLAATADIKISEVLIGGEKSSDNDEFIELYNPNTAPIDLSGFRLRYQNSKGTENSLAVIKSGSCIPSQGYFLWANSHGTYASVADLTTSAALTDNYRILLYAPESSGGTLLDSVSWGDATTPPLPPVTESLARDVSDFSWLPIHATPTPTKSTPCPLTEPTPPSDPLPPSPSSTLVRFNEIFSNPKGDETEGEFIELWSGESTDTDVSGWTIRDASKTGKYTFPTGSLLAPQSYFVLKRTISKLSLNNTSETLSLFDAVDTLVDSVQYEKTKEGVSQNRVGNGLRGGPPTPGSANQLNTLPETKEKVPKKGYRGVTVSFNARGKDSDGDHLKYTWDFGDGHKSYQKDPKHVYRKNGTYQVTLTTTDGSDDVTETFALKIGSFPKTDVRITAMVPNPSGKDSDNEWLLIENRGKKSVDLKNYSVATGWKKLTNHPIRDSFVIDPKSEAKLTREFSLFTLPNEKGKIELRTPDGKTLQKIKYKLEKSVGENVVYTKEKGKRWTWEESRSEEDIPEEESDETRSEEEDTPPEIIPATVPETAPETVAPLEEVPEEEVSIEKKVLGAETTRDEELHQELQELLSYGTRVTLPDDIRLSFDESASENNLVIAATDTPLDFFSDPFSLFNAWLNAWQNKEANQ